MQYNPMVPTTKNVVTNQIRDNKNITKRNKICADVSEMEKNSSSVESIVETVTSRLEYAMLKKEQKDATLSFVLGRDVFVALPTGCGKTICYCCLPMIYDQLKGRTGSIAVIIYSLA